MTKSGAGEPTSATPAVATAPRRVRVLLPSLFDSLPSTATSTPATRPTTSTPTRIRSQRCRRARDSVGPEERVDGNGREEEREVGVREREQPHCPLGTGVT